MNNDTSKAKQAESLRLSVLKKIMELLVAAFSFVAALAWNDAIQSLFAKLFGTADGLLPKFIYAIIVTAIVVWVALKIGSITKKIDKTEEKS